MGIVGTNLSFIGAKTTTMAVLMKPNEAEKASSLDDMIKLLRNVPAEATFFDSSVAGGFLIPWQFIYVVQ